MDSLDDGNSATLDNASFFPIVKELCLNKCPAVAPVGVLDAESDGETGWQRINLTAAEVERNCEALLAHPEFAEAMRERYENREEFPPAVDPESALYNGFLQGKDETFCNLIRNSDENRLADLHPEFQDERLPDLLVHYKARNYPAALAEDEVRAWEKYRLERLNRQMPGFMKQMEHLQGILQSGQTENEKGQTIDPFILEELMLWCQSLQPDDY